MHFQDGELLYKEMRTVGIFRKREKEVKNYDPTITVQDFQDGVLLKIEVIDSYDNGLNSKNLAIALDFEKQMTKS